MTIRSLASAILLLACLSLRAQSGGNFDLTWSTIDGGGGVSTGGVYSVTGTIGQPDAGTSSGGSFTLVGGFWGVTASVQAPPPSLRIERVAVSGNAGAVTISWPYPSTGWQLQESTNLGTTGWTDLTTTPAVVGNENQVVIASPLGNKFYRLKKIQ